MNFMKKCSREIEDLLLASMTGQLQDDDEKELYAWIAESEENAKQYAMFMQIMNKKRAKYSKARVLARINTKIGVDEKRRHQSLFLHKYLKAAVVIGFILLVQFFADMMMNDSTNDFVNTIYGKGVATEYILPDQSRVTLARGAEVSYNKAFGKTNRELKLKGKMYIEIEEKNTLPLICTFKSKKSKQVKVEHGAAMITCAASKITVAVHKGEAEVVGMEVNKKVDTVNYVPNMKLVKAKEMMVLLPAKKLRAGEILVYSGVDSVYKTKMKIENLISWKDKIFMFENETINDLSTQLSEWFDKDIIIVDEKNRDLRYTGRYKNPELTSLIKLIFGEENLIIDSSSEKILITIS